MRRIPGITAVIIALTAAVLVLPIDAQASPNATRVVRIVNNEKQGSETTAVQPLAAGPYYLYTSLLPYHQLDANPATMNDNGGTVWQWQYNGAIQQRWYFFNDNTIRPAGNTGMCLDANPNTNWNGGTVYLWSCNHSSQQHWYRTRNDGYQNGYSRRCLDANPNTNYNGGTIYEWDCNNAAQQHWYYGHVTA